MVVHAWQPVRHRTLQIGIPDPEDLFRTELLPALCDYESDNPIVIESLVEGPTVDALIRAARPAAMLVVGVTPDSVTGELYVGRTDCPVILVPA